MGIRHVVRVLTVLLSTLALALLAGTAAFAASAAPAAPAAPVDAAAVKAKLDALAARAPQLVPRSVTSWYVDPASKQFVVETTNAPEATTFAANAGAAHDGVRVVGVKQAPRPLANLVGGQKIQTSGGYCSIGFNARNSAGTRFVVTAGHCTVELSGTWKGNNNVTIGPAVGRNFPGDDYGSIQVTNTGQWTSTGTVQSGPNVKGSTEAAVGAQVCRSGATSGYHCGSIQAKNATVNYGGGDIVYGLTKTNVCAEPGDSGGTFITPAGQGQGMTSGGSGDCTSGGTTYFQPLNEALSSYGLTLITG